MFGQKILVDKLPVSFISDNGYETCTASSTMEGLDVVKQEKPDLITLDLQMPGEWGPRFYRKLRKDKELRDTPVIVVSGIDGDHAIKDAIADLQTGLVKLDLLQLELEP